MNIKIVIKTDEYKEVELGPFNQGLVIDIANDLNLMAPTTLRDVASGKAVARCRDGLWFVDGLDHSYIEQLFIQAA